MVHIGVNEFKEIKCISQKMNFMSDKSNKKYILQIEEHDMGDLKTLVPVDSVGGDGGIMICLITKFV